MGGFFKMSKDIFDDLFDSVLEYRLMSLIFRNVVFQEEGAMIEGIHVKRGQWVRSYRKLAEDLKYKEGRGYKQYSHQAIQKAMKRLEQRGYIRTRVIQLTDKFTGKLTDRLTLIEVVKPQENQGFNHDEENEQLTDQLTEQLTDQGTKIKKDKELKESNNHRKRKKRTYDADSPYMKMTQYFRQKIMEWKPDVKFKGDEQAWADEFRKIHELDKRSKQDIKAVIDWATSHSFWQANILSPKKLREKFDTLQAQMSRKVIPLQPPAWEERRQKEEETERKRLEQREYQIKVQKFIDAGFNPMKDADLLYEFLEGRITLNDLKSRKYGG